MSALQPVCLLFPCKVSEYKCKHPEGILYTLYSVVLLSIHVRVLQGVMSKMSLSWILTVKPHQECSASRVGKNPSIYTFYKLKLGNEHERSVVLKK